MAEIVIEAEEREAGSSNAARRMRREEKLPAVVYGGDKESTPIILDPREIISVLKSESGQNTIFKLKVGRGAEDNVMIFDVQIDPITYCLIHADLVRIALDVEIEVSVPLRIVVMNWASDHFPGLPPRVMLGPANSPEPLARSSPWHNVHIVPRYLPYSAVTPGTGAGGRAPVWS